MWPTRAIAVIFGSVPPDQDPGSVPGPCRDMLPFGTGNFWNLRKLETASCLITILSKTSRKCPLTIKNQSQGSILVLSCEGIGGHWFGLANFWMPRDSLGIVLVVRNVGTKTELCIVPWRSFQHWVSEMPTNNVFVWEGEGHLMNRSLLAGMVKIFTSSHSFQGGGWDYPSLLPTQNNKLGLESKTRFHVGFF